MHDDLEATPAKIRDIKILVKVSIYRREQARFMIVLFVVIYIVTIICRFFNVIE